MDAMTRQREPVLDLPAWRAHLDTAGLLPPDTCAAFCVGSVARGWATPTSDCDIYVVTRAPFRTAESVDVSVPLHPDVVPVHVTDVDGRSWEIKYWTDDQVDQMLRK